jgi:mannose-6-phosphate isomerase-like protein (cupin superfamily)
MTLTANKQGLTKFTYEKPVNQEKPKVTLSMARSDVLGVGIQVAKEGGDTNLHAHAATESLWLVLKGRVRFYDGLESMFGEYGPLEGIAIPRAAPYWFESASDDDLEILHITAVNPLSNNIRLNFQPLRERQIENHDAAKVRDVSKHHAKPMKHVKYESPEFDKFPKMITSLHNDQDLMRIDVQKIKDGGETNMHSHTGVDSAWFVLAGEARFHGFEESDTHDLGHYEGIFIPKATPYWFESVGDEPLEIFHVVARDVRVEKNERVNYESLKDWQEDKDLGGREATATDVR